MELVPKPEGEPRVIGAPTGQVARRGLETSWKQHLDSIEVELVELRQCRTLVHEPVVRIERTKRSAGGALYWEFGLGGALAGLGIAGLISPAFLSNTIRTEDGELEKNLESGRRLAGIALGVGSVFLIAGIVDAVRSRNQVRYADAYRLRPGDPVACARGSKPLADRPVTLIVDAWRAEGVTNPDGQVTFLLPREPEQPTPKRTLHRGVVRYDTDRAVTIDFVAPYGATLASPHRGRSTVAPH